MARGEIYRRGRGVRREGWDRELKNENQRVQNEN